MIYFQPLILSAFLPFLLCSTTKILPRAQRAAIESEEAFLEIDNGILRAREYPHPRSVSIPRRWDEFSVPAREGSSESPLAAIKRTLLGTRQSSCDSGYALCHSESLYSQPAQGQARGGTDNWGKPPKDAALTAVMEDAATMEPA